MNKIKVIGSDNNQATSYYHILSLSSLNIYTSIGPNKLQKWNSNQVMASRLFTTKPKAHSQKQPHEHLI